MSPNIVAENQASNPLPPSFNDFASKFTGGKGPTSQFYTHCGREFFHEQMKALIDDEFAYAWEHGIVIRCGDGISRRFYPRIFTYSADYPEKILLASIRDKGACPCPRCLVPKMEISKLGSAEDRQKRKSSARVDDVGRRRNIAKARNLIYKENNRVNGAAVERILKEASLVPNQNAFSDNLSHLGFNFFQMLAVDLLHEFELGVWKALFTHLLRILAAINPDLLNELDRRYRQIPTFGKGTIRKFSSNTSQMKKLAARDFEDILQCALPVFDGLLTGDNQTSVMRLLFICAHWHGLAKLRMHSDPTLQLLDDLTTEIGSSLREFSSIVCPSYKTRELPRELEARHRRAAKQSKADDVTPTSITRLETTSMKFEKEGQQIRIALSPLYQGELEHRTPKARYRRTDKKLFIKQLTQIERRQTRLRRLRRNYFPTSPLSHSNKERLNGSAKDHHHIGKSEALYEDIGSFLRTRDDDPATKNFLPKLKAHLLPRIQAARVPSDLAYLNQVQAPLHTVEPQTLDNVLFKFNRLYFHNTMCVNYTTYDIRRAQDTINVNTERRDIMVLSKSDSSGTDDSDESLAFIYARVLGICHVNVVQTGAATPDYTPQRFNFLWVRWFRRVSPGSW
ncbi:uncharacterized protein LACBIDRAFT_312455 [Laccaria bicolor S238N-H82]|uniref:Predicted protein n=1 Tax=Laccaria bicolor (strain S238N-H82 / ATCC MYA-4686) TaxID=486041 RepID=B0DW74_LACBS|nr:uncharacterized protein LACBIDRAFT_312455 [Laccaria bicolor S238N-H82]EDR01180.1 predicted protein [Laccaria bicolor S238N-H82]|eukprot:XP_001888222.1 predicted protein [Laccaria bicolor S238N-H82]